MEIEENSIETITVSKRIKICDSTNYLVINLDINDKGMCYVRLINGYKSGAVGGERVVDFSLPVDMIKTALQKIIESEEQLKKLILNTINE